MMNPTRKLIGEPSYYRMVYENNRKTRAEGF
jgi:hypothetical protein